MVASVNDVRFIGHLAQDPDLRYYPSGEAYASAVIITNKKVKNRKTGEVKEYSQGHRVICHGPNAEFVGKYLKSGHYVYFQGELRHRSYQENGETKWISEVYGRMQTLTKKQADAEEGQAAPANVPPASVPVPEEFDSYDDDIPF